MGINIAFLRRPFKLGDTIHLTVELVPRRDIRVSEARVDLVCETRHTEVTTALVPPLPSQTSRLRERKRVSEIYRDSHLYGSVVFVRGERLPSGQTSTYNVGLEIPLERPTHNSGSTSWKLATTVDIVGARNITARRVVNVLA